MRLARTLTIPALAMLLALILTCTAKADWPHGAADKALGRVDGGFTRQPSANNYWNAPATDVQANAPQRRYSYEPAAGTNPCQAEKAKAAQPKAKAPAAKAPQTSASAPRRVYSYAPTQNQTSTYRSYNRSESNRQPGYFSAATKALGEY